VRRGEVWLAQVGGKRRPVLVLTRSEVLDVRQLVTVAEITSSMRGLAAEVPIDHLALGLARESAVNCDGLHTVRQSILTDLVGKLTDTEIRRVCDALAYAVGC
jgi:mRNA interferase MazF